MGNNASNDHKTDRKQSTSKLPSIPEVREQQQYVRSPTVSNKSQNLTELNITSPYNENVRYASQTDLDNKSRKSRTSNRISTPLRNSSNLHPDLDVQAQLPSSRAPSSVSNRSNSRTSTVLLPAISSPIRSNRNNSIALGNMTGRCPFCTHCKETTSQGCSSKAEFKWIVNGPEDGNLMIDMIEYDELAVRERIQPKNGHLPGEYDYKPQLAIEKINEESGNYYSQTCVANSKEKIAPRYTPFPNYDLIQRREYQSNKIRPLTVHQD